MLNAIAHFYDCITNQAQFCILDSHNYCQIVISFHMDKLVLDVQRLAVQYATLKSKRVATEEARMEALMAIVRVEKGGNDAAIKEMQACQKLLK